MLAIAFNARIFFFRDYVDMRKGVEKLSSLVESFHSGQLMTGAYFVFVNRSKDIMKVLYWDNDGFVIWWKRLEKGTFKLLGNQKILIDRKEFFMMLEGITPKQIQKRFTIT